MTNQQTIQALAGIVRDSAKPLQERRDALRHFATLRGELTAIADTIAEDEFCALIEAATAWSAIGVGIHDISVQDALDHVRTIRARRAAGSPPAPLCRRC